MQEIERELNKILNDYKDEVDELSNDSCKKSAQSCSRDLKQTSPRRTGAYASDWAVKTTRGAGGSEIYTVYNRKHYQVTHLLEKGHVIRNKKGEYGRAPAHPHIAPAAKRAEEELIRLLEAKL